MGHSPAGAEVAVCVRKGGAVLAEVAVEGRGEALEADAEESVQCLEDVHRQRALQACALVADSGMGGGKALFGEGNGTPLQYYCLENPTDGGAWKSMGH